jgi:hypothetical protein
VKRSTRGSLPLLGLALALTGCAPLAPLPGALASGAPRAGLQVSGTRAVPTAPEASTLPCPPESRILERDLTVPWDQRRYVLSQGGVCRPGGPS